MDFMILFWHFCTLCHLGSLSPHSLWLYGKKQPAHSSKYLLFVPQKEVSHTGLEQRKLQKFHFLHKLILSSPVLDNIKDKLGESSSDCLWRLYLFNRKPELYHFWTSSWNMHQQTISWTVWQIKFSPMRRVSTCLFVLRPTVPCDPEKRWKILAPAVQPIISFIW